MKKNPSDSIDFGKHKGKSLEDIYAVDPTYLHFLVKYVDNFVIDINDFYKLPRPLLPSEQLSEPKTEIEKFWQNGLDKQSFNSHSGAFSKILNADGEVINYEFKFADETLVILEQKRDGTYVAPEWERQIDWSLKMFTIDDLLALEDEKALKK